MTQYVIPLAQLPNQEFNITLGEQECIFTFITRGVYMYMNLTVNGENLINGQICLKDVPLIQYKSLKFKGQLYFKDTQGDLDPLYYGLNDRWILIYDDSDTEVKEKDNFVPPQPLAEKVTMTITPWDIEYPIVGLTVNGEEVDVTPLSSFENIYIDVVKGVPCEIVFKGQLPLMGCSISMECDPDGWSEFFENETYDEITGTVSHTFSPSTDFTIKLIILR